MINKDKHVENGKVSLQFGRDQLVSASVMARQFGKIKQAAKHKPLYITDNGRVDLVLVDYEQFEALFQRIHELEHEVLQYRMEEAENNPESLADWRSNYRTPKQEDE